MDYCTSCLSARAVSPQACPHISPHAMLLQVTEMCFKEAEEHHPYNLTEGDIDG